MSKIDMLEKMNAEYQLSPEVYKYLKSLPYAELLDAYRVNIVNGVGVKQ